MFSGVRRGGEQLHQLLRCRAQAAGPAVPAEVGTVKRTFARVAPDADAFAAAFYARFDEAARRAWTRAYRLCAETMTGGHRPVVAA